MTKEERENIFAKECLTIEDVEKLYEVSKNTAAAEIRKMKDNLRLKGKSLRLEIVGKIHIADYLDYIGASGDRYSIKEEKGA